MSILVPDRRYCKKRLKTIQKRMCWNNRFSICYYFRKNLLESLIKVLKSWKFSWIVSKKDLKRLRTSNNNVLCDRNKIFVGESGGRIFYAFQLKTRRKSSPPRLNNNVSLSKFQKDDISRRLEYLTVINNLGQETTVRLLSFYFE